MDRQPQRGDDRPGSGPNIRLATDADVASLVAMLVRSFDDDPVACFMFAGDRRRRRGLHAFFSSQIRHQYLPHGHVYTTNELDGAALWGPPGVPRSGLRELVELLPAAPYLASNHIHRALQLLFQTDGLRPKEPHWYLGTVGTEPARQGKGVGTALLGSMVERIDESGYPAYLESSKERNVSFYIRFGFEVVEELHTVIGSPPIWRMLREPRAPSL